MKKILISLFIFSIFFVGCSDSSTQNSNNVSTEKVKGYVSQKDFGDTWPLTVSGGRVECKRGIFAVFHYRNKIYALNGSAMSKGYKRIDPIWKDNPEIKGTKISIGILIDEAMKLCE